MKICIFAETKDFDIRLYKVLCTRLLKECYCFEDIEFADHSFDPEGKGNLLKHLCTEIDLISEQNPDLEIIFVFADCDDLAPKKQRKIIRDLINEHVTHFPSENIILGSPKRNVEGWLLSDIDNLNHYLPKSIKEFPHAEIISDPKIAFKSIWEMSGKHEKKPIFASQLCSSINFMTLCRRSQTFLTFHEDLRQIIEIKYPHKSHTGHQII